MTDIRAALKEKFNMDLDTALQELGLPAAAFERVVRVSLASVTKTMLALDAAIAANDTAAIAAGAHALKGVFMNLRLATLAGPVKQMEVLLQAGAPAEDIRRQMGILQVQYALLQEIFK